MKDHHENNSTKMFYFLLFIELILVIFLIFQRHENISFGNEPLVTMNDNWTYVDDNGVKQLITLPTTLEAGEDNNVMISRKLPSDVRLLSSIGILTVHQNIKVYVGHKMIYSRNKHAENHLLNIPSKSIWDIIPLPMGAEGKIITIQFSSEYNDYAGRINEIHAGTKSSILIHNMVSFGLGFILSIIILASGVMLVVLYQFSKRLLNSNRSFLYLGWFSILIAIWLLMESNLMQMAFGNAYIISALSYLSLMAFPIPILLFITLIEGYHYVKFTKRCIYIFLYTDFIVIFLQVFNIIDFHNSFYVVHTEIFIILGLILITLCLEFFKYKNKEIKLFTISFCILFTFGVFEPLTYRIQSERSTGEYLQIGFLIFTIVLFWDTLKKLVDIIKLSETAKHYKYLATRDPLTNCRSRVAYAKDMDRIDLSKNITIFMADMNNMKQINDTYGHHAGDEVIILCSIGLLKVFGRRVYRIGGDEFVCIEYDLTEAETDRMMSEFLAECMKSNEDNPYTFDMSIGYAKYDNTVDKDIYDTVKRADKDMYDRKTKMKEQ